MLQRDLAEELTRVMHEQSIDKFETTDRAIGTETKDGIMLSADVPVNPKEEMILAYEPMFVTDVGQWVPEVNPAVTKNGYDLLSSYPIDLQVTPRTQRTSMRLESLV